MNDRKVPLTLRILDCKGQSKTLSCDAVKLYVKDDKRGKGGGWLGIHQGHAPALIALGDGSVKALLNGEEVLSHAVQGGIAAVLDDTVTLFLS